MSKKNAKILERSIAEMRASIADHWLRKRTKKEIAARQKWLREYDKNPPQDGTEATIGAIAVIGWCEDRRT